MDSYLFFLTESPEALCEERLPPESDELEDDLLPEELLDDEVLLDDELLELLDELEGW